MFLTITNCVLTILIIFFILLIVYQIFPLKEGLSTTTPPSTKSLSETVSELLFGKDSSPSTSPSYSPSKKREYKASLNCNDYTNGNNNKHVKYVDLSDLLRDIKNANANGSNSLLYQSFMNLDQEGLVYALLEITEIYKYALCNSYSDQHKAELLDQTVDFTYNIAKYMLDNPPAKPTTSPAPTCKICATPAPTTSPPPPITCAPTKAPCTAAPKCTIPPPLPVAGYDIPGINILEAWWGVDRKELGGYGNDVTDSVKYAYRNYIDSNGKRGNPVLTAKDAFLKGDPQKGSNKRLFITYIHPFKDGKTIRIIDQDKSITAATLFDSAPLGNYYPENMSQSAITSGLENNLSLAELNKKELERQKQNRINDYVGKVCDTMDGKKCI